MCSQQDTENTHMLCPQCDMLVALPRLTWGTKSVCPRCGTTLAMRWRHPHLQPTLYAISALFLLVVANLFSFVTMSVAGISNAITLIEIPGMLMSENYVSIATLFMIFVQVIPAFCMVVIILLCLRVPLPAMLRVGLARILLQCRAWCMVEIFLAGVLVSFVKLMAYGDVGVGSSFWAYCLFCLLQVRAFQMVDRRLLWDDIAAPPPCDLPQRCGDTGLRQGLRSCACCTAILPADQHQCPRCLTTGYARRRNSLQWTLALLVTALLLYIPANLLPIMVTQALGSKLTSTIMAGVILLWGEGSYPVAMVIFIASIMVPSLKILSIAWLCWASRHGTGRDSERMHVIYEIVEFVGRWSMIDVFVIAVLSSLVSMGRLMSIYPDIGAILFAAVVIITMISAMVFDPRLLWDRESRVPTGE
ncbi:MULTISPECIES: membrane integrity-associated transporter subunit PqiA [Edwardsiella]|uniref:Paraquat-inducible protein A n=2 Tax=Edwardsiella anguillarum TaxID=1821960 RepID=A0A076LP39_9GAMM|nr:MULTISPECIES: membrane integrity-associated transporter subunit PqiA [Edwardsiella]AKM48262.1 paraquat-inducible protein A [Edwardsiella sp. EA181011]GAJ66547.1 PqiA family integral membrane protein [Edwardsiella piscicida]AIJ09641.1 Paraquat-inducible protein A [Edwardsiella anguillarum ET080813]AKR77387.2 membrane integrity-associated transporter subunit PqiA [Edwardsiella sp. LADL05-105]KAB0592608.1 membrane integrity-associated transporter subunit PqiA [Edwardsiella anguillarum]